MKIVLKIDYDDAGIIKSWVGWYEWVIWGRGGEVYLISTEHCQNTKNIYILGTHKQNNKCL